jgi:hypothetical protein
MRRRQAVKINYARTILIVGVLACLCFSTGEGLRLIPIATPITEEASWPDLGTIKTSHDVSTLYQYATCGLEKSSQKRTQRQQAHRGLLTSHNSGKSFPKRVQLTADIELASYGSLLHVSRPIGRAPPSA